MEQEKPPTQHIKAAPAIDANEYIERELKEFGYKEGKIMGTMLELLIANHVHIRCVVEAVRDTDVFNHVANLVVEQNIATLRRAASMGELTQEQVDIAALKSNEMIDCLDSLIDSTETNLH